MTPVTLVLDADGVPEATGDGEAAILAAFLNSDVPDADYAEELAAAAARGGPGDWTGNAFAATIGAEGVMLTHLHDRRRGGVLVAGPHFAAELRRWAAALRGGG